MSELIQLRDVTKTYRRGAETIQALNRITLAIKRGEFIAIVGPSGSGKTTLLHIMGCMDRPTEGEVAIDGTSLGGLGDDRLTALRRTMFGFVFQQFFLLPTLTAMENVQLPTVFARSDGRVQQRAEELLVRVGLKDRFHHRPRQLSGGEMQRVAIARALINEPKVLLADEPTGNLDSHTAAAIMDIFCKLSANDLTILMVTHNAELARQAARTIRLKDGRIDSAAS